MIDIQERKIPKIPKRGLGRAKADITLKSLYKEFKQKYIKPALKSDNKLEKQLILTEKEFLNINYDYLQEVMKAILEDSEVFDIPFNGRLRIRKRAMDFDCLRRNKSFKINFGEYLKTGIKSYHLNEHTNNQIAEFFWSKVHIRKANWYSFKPSRTNLRKLSKMMFNQVQYWE